MKASDIFIFVIPFGVISGICNVSETLALIFTVIKRENVCYQAAQDGWFLQCRVESLTRRDTQAEKLLMLFPKWKSKEV